ncbi:MAG: hypothetical protein Q8L04_05710 [Ignavibacteria bacterium]|nr:hypothetical protein [Ignavibacteria bacterium]
MRLFKSKYVLGLLFLMLISCKDEVLLQNEVNKEMLYGVWVRDDIVSENYIEKSWVPTNLHIGVATDANKIRIRTLDPIACKDAYAEIIHLTVSYTQYGLSIVVKFENSESGTITVSKNQSKSSSRIYKINREPYWGACD